MTAPLRHLVHLSSAEIAFLHALVQQQMRGHLAERPEGCGMEAGTAPPELISLDRRLLARLEEVAREEEAYFGEWPTGPEAAGINEEHAALAEVAARGEEAARWEFGPAAGAATGSVRRKSAAAANGRV